MSVPYRGNGAYCYANSLYMSLLGADAEVDTLPEPGFLECLTAMPFGTTYFRWNDQPTILFSSPNNDPDTGLTHAIKALGWACRESHGEDSRDAINRLKRAVKLSSALVGPLDMGYLVYNPDAKILAGADHFVVVLAVEEEGIRIHDPAGYPYALLPVENFLLAWHADRIPYRSGSYTLRTRFRKLKDLTRQEMIHRALPTIKENLVADPDGSPIWGEAGPEIYGGVQALYLLADDLREEVPVELANLLTGFALPLAARRCLDAAKFLQEGHLLAAASTLEQQARLYGQAQLLAVQQQWSELADVIEALAKLERNLLSVL